MQLYVLIILVVSNFTPAVSTSVAEFTSKEKCEIAGAAISSHFSSLKRSPYYVCVQK